MHLIYFVDNKLGGVTSLNHNLVANCPYSDVEQWVIHIHQDEWAMAKADIPFHADKEINFNYSGAEHAYRMLKRLRETVPEYPGALVLNYGNEMAMLDHYPVKQTTYQLVHDMYNVKLAAKYGHIVDVFICHNRHIYGELVKLFPERSSDIFHLPHGVRVPQVFQEHKDTGGPLKLLFLGRMTRTKGIFDLPVIHSMLKDAGVSVEWTCIGNGPDLQLLKDSWPDAENIKFLSPAGNDEVMEICAHNHVFVLPTKFEGSPVSLLETMSAGLVPVISALPGGIVEIVKSDIGYALPLDDNRAFADAIIELHHDREKLATMGKKCRQIIIDHFDVRNTAKTYHDLFRQYHQHFSAKKLKKHPVGARLDHPLIPPFVTRFLRKMMEVNKP